MNEIHVQQNKDLGLVVSSRVIAKELNRRHSDVLDNLTSMILENGNVRSLVIPSTYKVIAN